MRLLFLSPQGTLTCVESPKAVTETALRHLIDMEAVKSVTVVGVARGFTVDLSSGTGTPKRLTTVRGKARHFASLDTAGTFLKGLGVTNFSVEMSGYQPGRLRGARPDRAVALRNTRTRFRQQELLL